MKNLGVHGKWLSLSIVVLGCGGSQAAAPAASTPNELKEQRATGPVGPVSKHGSGTVAAKIGAAGGTLELSEGPRISVPAGAVDEALDFVLKVAAKTTVFLNNEGERALGPTFSFSPPADAPSGTTFEVSYPLSSLPSGWGDPSIAFEYEEGSTIHGEDSTRTKWQHERASLVGGRVTAKLPRVTGLRMQFVLANLETQ